MPDDKPHVLTIRLPPELFKWLRHHTIDADTSINQIIVDLLEAYRKKKG